MSAYTKRPSLVDSAARERTKTIGNSWNAILLNETMRRSADLFSWMNQIHFVFNLLWFSYECLLFCFALRRRRRRRVTPDQTGSVFLFYKFAQNFASACWLLGVFCFPEKWNFIHKKKWARRQIVSVHWWAPSVDQIKRQTSITDSRSIRVCVRRRPAFWSSLPLEISLHRIERRRRD